MDELLQYINYDQAIKTIWQLSQNGWYVYLDKGIIIKGHDNYKQFEDQLIENYFLYNNGLSHIDDSILYRALGIDPHQTYNLPDDTQD